jgi:hypothetical protein
MKPFAIAPHFGIVKWTEKLDKSSDSITGRF